MKNITLAIEADILEKVRVVAAERRTSVNAMVRDFLTEIAHKREERQGAAGTTGSYRSLHRRYGSELEVEP